MRVFISCTTDGMGLFRDAVCDRPIDWWGDAPRLPEFSSMLDAKAESIPPVDWSIRQAAGSDLLVLLLGEHHGAMAEAPDPRRCGVPIERLKAVRQSIPGWSDVDDPTRLSYTQWEVLAAVAAQVPVLVFSPDRRSDDEDLQACRSGHEPAALRQRQACFGRWIRSRCSEDHFANRLDLVNKVRKAILRHHRRRRARRAVRVALVLAVAVTAGGVIGHHWYQSAQRERQAAQQADQLQQEMLRRQYAVALGGSLAMLNRSSTGAGRPVFEMALIGLDMPAEQRGQLADEYNRIDDRRANDSAEAEILNAQRARLRRKVLTRLNVIRPAAVGYIDFGQHATELLLLLKHWNDANDEQTLRAVAGDRLTHFQAACDQVALPDDLRRAVMGLNPADLAQSDQRAAAVRLIDECLGRYDMQPPT